MKFFTAVALSPPPTILIEPFYVASTHAKAIAFVPFSKLLISNTPAGPFHTIVLLLFIVSANNFSDSGPQSKPSKSSGIPYSFVTIVMFASLLNLSAARKSTGNII